MSEPTKPREWWVDEDALCLGSYIFAHDHDGSIPTKCVHVREVSTQIDAAVLALVKFVEAIAYAGVTSLNAKAHNALVDYNNAVKRGAK